MSEKENLIALYDLRYFESKDIGQSEVTRVPGGWIFKSITRHYDHAKPIGVSESSAFVPYKRVDINLE